MGRASVRGLAAGQLYPDADGILFLGGSTINYPYLAVDFSGRGKDGAFVRRYYRRVAHRLNGLDDSALTRLPGRALDGMFSTTRWDFSTTSRPG